LLWETKTGSCRPAQNETPQLQLGRLNVPEPTALCSSCSVSSPAVVLPPSWQHFDWRPNKDAELFSEMAVFLLSAQGGGVKG